MPERAHERGAAGREVDPGLSLARGGEQPVLAARDLFDLLRSEDHRYHHVHASENVGGIGSPFRAHFDQRLGGLRADVVDDQREAPPQDIAGGMGAHGAETDESDPHPKFSWFAHGPLALLACALIGVRRAGKAVSGDEHAALHQAACGAVHGEAGKAGRVRGGEIDRDLGDA